MTGHRKSLPLVRPIPWLVQEYEAVGCGVHADSPTQPFRTPSDTNIWEIPKQKDYIACCVDVQHTQVIGVSFPNLRPRRSLPIIGSGTQLAAPRHDRDQVLVRHRRGARRTAAIVRAACSATAIAPWSAARSPSRLVSIRAVIGTSAAADPRTGLSSSGLAPMPPPSTTSSRIEDRAHRRDRRPEARRDVIDHGPSCRVPVASQLEHVVDRRKLRIIRGAAAR